jgi:hypothetical protein
MKSQDSVISVVTRLRAETSRVSNLSGTRDFICLQQSRPAGVHPTSCSVLLGFLSLGVKKLRHETDYSLPFSVEFKNKWNHTLFPLHDFMVHTGTTLPLPSNKSHKLQVPPHIYTHHVIPLFTSKYKSWLKQELVKFSKS